MKKIKIYTLLLYALVAVSALLSAACSRNTPMPVHSVSQNDSTKSADSTSNPVSGRTERVLTYEERQGKYLYTKYCVVCHAEEGKGDGFNAFNLDPKPRDFTDSRYMNTLTDERIIQTITGGGRSVNRSALMPSWGGRMNLQEIKYLVAYIRLFSTP